MAHIMRVNLHPYDSSPITPASQRQPSSPSKSSRPLSWSFATSPSASQSLWRSPWRYFSGYCIPYVVRVVQTRRWMKFVLSVIGILGVAWLLMRSSNPDRATRSSHSSTNFDDTTLLLNNDDDILTSSLPPSSYSFNPLDHPPLRDCSPADLMCRLQDVPVYHHSAGTSNRRTNLPQHKRVLLVVVNGGFKEMALNLICSGERIGHPNTNIDDSHAWSHGRIPRSAWLIACSDDECYDYFIARSIPAVRMNQTSALTEISTSAASSSNIGSHAAGWGETTHININREKIPLLLTLLQLDIDVILIDADVVFVRAPLEEMFNKEDDEHQRPADLQVMYDYPGITMPQFGSTLDDCLLHPYTNVSLPCTQAYEMNGGFFLLYSNSRTIELLRDMTQWLKKHPKEHDQDALRAALRNRAMEKRLAWKLDDGGVYPPTSATAATDTRLSYRFISNLLAPNGGLYFMSARREYLDASSSSSSPDPIAIHVNWLVGYTRKELMMRQYGLWFIERVNGGDANKINGRLEGYCRSDVVLSARKRRQSTASDRILIRPPLNPHRIYDSRTTSSVSRPPHSSSPSADVLLFTTLKPLAAYSTASFPRARKADADGMGEVRERKEEDYTEESVVEWKAQQQIQMNAQLMIWRSWYAMTDTTSMSGGGKTIPAANIVLYTPDPQHAALSRTLRFDHISSYSHDEYGVPYLHSLFQTSERIAKKRGITSVMYTNGDLMYSPDETSQTVQAIKSYRFSSYFAVGLRRNVDVREVEKMMSVRDREERERLREVISKKDDADPDILEAYYLNLTRHHPLNISSLSAHTFFTHLSTLSTPYRTDALDYFLWSPGFFDYNIVPKILLGRIGYDNWLVHYANTRARAETASGLSNLAVIDMSETVNALHIDHYVSKLKVKEGVLRKEKEMEMQQQSSSSVDSASSQILSTHTELSSHFQPNTMQNIRLSGQTSLKGLGKLEHVGWRSIRRKLPDGDTDIIIVKSRPESGHIANLYDVAQEAAVVIDGRQSLIVLAVDDAHIGLMKQWTGRMRRLMLGSKKRGDLLTLRSGILILSTSPNVTSTAQSLGLSVFELSPNSDSSRLTALNSSPTSNLHILTLKSRAYLLLIEFGYDVLVSSVSAVWKRHPWKVMQERAEVVESVEEEKRDVRDSERTTKRYAQPQRKTSSSTYFYPSLLHIDLITLSYDSSPHNVTSLTLLLRHTPNTLHMLRRILSSHLQMLAKATLPHQVNYANLGHDWFVQHEVFTSANGLGVESEDERLTHATIVMKDGVFVHDDIKEAQKRMPSSVASSLPHLPAGPILDPDIVMVNGYWFDRPGGLGAAFADGTERRWREEGLWRENEKDDDGETDDLCISSSICDPPLTSSSITLLPSLATHDRSLLVLPVFSSSNNKEALNTFLSRCTEIGFRHVVLIAERERALSEVLSEENYLKYKEQAVYLPSPSTSSLLSSLIISRLHHLLSEGYHLGLVNLETAPVLFESPFEYVRNLRMEEEKNGAASSLLLSSGYTRSSSLHTTLSMLHPLSDQRCDTFTHTASTLTPSVSVNEKRLWMVSRPKEGGDEEAEVTPWTFISLQPSEQTKVWLSRTVECMKQSEEKDGISNKKNKSPYITFISCLESVGNHLRSFGHLSVCDLDAYYFPPPPSFFTPPSSSFVSPPSPTPSQTRILSSPTPSSWKHVSETGVYPFVIPTKWIDVETGRITEWKKEWREQVEAIAPSVKVETPKMRKDGAIKCVSSSSFNFRIRLLTFTRVLSLKRLLESLILTDFGEDSGSITLEVSVDREEGDSNKTTPQQELDAARRIPFNSDIAAASKSLSSQRQQLLSYLSSFHWPHGELKIILQSKHLGLVGQWIHHRSGASTDPIGERLRNKHKEQNQDQVLVLEDDLEISPLFYRWLKGAMCEYYYSSQFDPRLFGISLQTQSYVVGQSAKNSRYQFMRWKQEKSRRESSSAIIDPATLFEFDLLLGDPSSHSLYKYQLLGTWGLLVFPQHWHAFEEWYWLKQAEQPPFHPCIPHLASSSWYAARPQSVWSQWMIRYVWEQGWYCLYSNNEEGKVLVKNWREKGENHDGGTSGNEVTMKEVLMTQPPISQSLQHYSTSTNPFSYPSLSSLPLFDYHLSHVTLNPLVLQQRRAFHTEASMKRGCEKRDYKMFNGED